MEWNQSTALELSSDLSWVVHRSSGFVLTSSFDDVVAEGIDELLVGPSGFLEQRHEHRLYGAVVIDRSRDVVRFGLSEVLESVFDDEPIVDYDHLAVEARCVRFIFKGRRMRLPLKQFLDWWTLTVPSSTNTTDEG